MGYSSPLPCADCGWDTFSNEGPREWYRLNNEIWESTGMSVHGGTFLCIGCVEARLGRELVPRDFAGHDPDPRDSDRLRDRTGQ